MKVFSMITAVFLMFSMNLAGQNFAQPGTEWYYSDGGGSIPKHGNYLLLRSVKDTIIQGQRTQKIARTQFKAGGDTVEKSPFFLYEKRDTVYWYSDVRKSFKVLYDFSANQGDTMTLNAPDFADTSSQLPSNYQIVVDTVVERSIDTFTFKEFKTTPLDRFEFGGIVKGVGGKNNFFPLGPNYVPEAIRPLRCYTRGPMKVNFLENVQCDYVYSASRPLPKEVFEVYPNPTDGELKIQTEKQIQEIQVYDLTGKLIMDLEESSPDISMLPKGQYIMTISFGSGEQMTRKVMKTAE